MLMHKLLGRHAKPEPKPRPSPRNTTEIKLYNETSFGVVQVDTLLVDWFTQEELSVIIARALRTTGVNLLRIGTTEYRLNVHGDVYWTSMWHGVV